MVAALPTQAEVEASLLCLNAQAQHAQHHKDNAVWVQMHRELNALLDRWRMVTRDG